MARKPSVTTRTALAALKAHRKKGAPTDMRKAFDRDAGRFAALSAKADDLLLDHSKCAVNTRTMKLLADLAKAADVAGKRDAMFAGAIINTTEGRAVLHTALRNRSNVPVMVDGSDVMPDVNGVLNAMAGFARSVRASEITDVVNIGIGGSDLGPAMTTLALAPYHDGPRIHYVSNVDGAHIADTLKTLDAKTTLFLIASKTFTTIETMTNARTARKWVAEALGEAAVGDHFAAISTAIPKVKDFGISVDRIFGFWDWVGGRYSIWSAIGLPLMIAIGSENFTRFLDGGHAMDRHFREAPILENLPMLMGLLGVWHRNICNHPSRAIIPYDQRLSRFPAYLQQLDMESNGKRVTKDGTAIRGSTGPIVWGEPGTNGQHAFYQLIHQGTQLIPADFIAVATPAHPIQDGDADVHELFLSNFFAQTKALAFGKTAEEVRAEGTAEAIVSARVFTGNRPTTSIMAPALTPSLVGQLIALYEHITFTQGVVWGINSFDQWGVELGKQLALQIAPAVAGDPAALAAQDPSTQSLVRYYLEHRR